ncbi:MAG: hypothetical protein AB7O88_14210 [Reyranellaceae bacterium]
MKMKALVHVGFIPRFKWADTLLFTGNGPSLRRLAELVEGGPETRNDLADLLRCQGMTLKVIAKADETAVIKQGSDFVWCISGQDGPRYAAQIGAVADSTGHHYLDSSGAADIDVMVSHGEYDTAVFS